MNVCAAGRSFVGPVSNYQIRVHHARRTSHFARTPYCLEPEQADPQTMPAPLRVALCSNATNLIRIIRVTFFLVFIMLVRCCAAEEPPVLADAGAFGRTLTIVIQVLHVVAFDKRYLQGCKTWNWMARIGMTALRVCQSPSFFSWDGEWCKSNACRSLHQSGASYTPQYLENCQQWHQ